MFTEFSLYYGMKEVMITSVRALVIAQAFLNGSNQRVPYRLYEIAKSRSGPL